MQIEEEIDNLVEDEYVQEGDVEEEEVPDLDQGEPMEDDDDEEDMDGNDSDEPTSGQLEGSQHVQLDSADGFEVRPNADDENTMELADDSVQGFFDHREPVYAIAMHPTSNGIIVSGGGDDKSYLWRCDTGEMMKCLDGHTDSVTAVAFSCDGKYVASAAMDGKVRVWNAETGDFCVSVDGPDEIIWIDWHPKGNILLAGANDSTIWMWASKQNCSGICVTGDSQCFIVPSGKFMNIFNGHAGPVTAGCFTPDGKKIVSTSEDSSFIIWDPKSAAAEFRLSGDDARFHAEVITSVCVNKDSTLAITGDATGKARLVNILNGNVSALYRGFLAWLTYLCCRLLLRQKTTQIPQRHLPSVMCKCLFVHFYILVILTSSSCVAFLQLPPVQLTVQFLFGMFKHNVSVPP